MNKEELVLVKKSPLNSDYKVRESKIKFSRKYLGIPYGLFLTLFVVIPLLLIIYYAFTDADGHISLGNFIKFFSNSTTLTTIIVSVIIAFFTTLISLIMAYPIAYILARTNLNRGGTMLMLFIAPMWINFVLRSMAMKDLLTLMGLIGEYNYLCTIIGMVYDFLPFMILSLYSVLSKMDNSLIEASKDLGANSFQTFIRVIFPLSIPGISSGITMVFMPTMTCYVISDTLGNGLITIIGKLIDEQFTTFQNWNLGSAIAIILLAIMLVSMAITGGFKSEDARGANL